MKAWISCLAFLVLMGGAVSMRPCSALAATDNKELARWHFKKASQLYDLGKFDEALAEYEQAYTLHEDPSLLFNMAQTCRRKGDLKRALDLYKNYLVKDPESPMRAEVESRIKALKAQIEQGEKPAAEAAPVVPPAVVPPPPDTGQALQPPAPIPPATPAPTTPPASGTPASAPVWPAPAPTPSYAPSATVAPSGAAAVAAPLVPSPSSPPVAAPVYVPPAQSQASPSTPPTTTPGYDQTAPASPVFQAPAVPAPAPSPPAPVASAQQSAPTYSPARESNSSGLPLMITGGIVTAGGLVCVSLGIYNAVQAQTLSDRVTSAKTFNPSDDSQGKRAARFAKIEIGVGIGATAVGAILVTLGILQHSSQQSKVAVVPVLQANGAMLAATGGF